MVFRLLLLCDKCCRRETCCVYVRQTSPGKADLSPPNLFSLHTDYQTYLQHTSCIPSSQINLFSSSSTLSLPPPPLSHPALFPPSLLSSLFFFPSCSKVVRVKIIDDEEYEKNKNFFLELAEPRMVDMSLQKGTSVFYCLPTLSPVHLCSLFSVHIFSLPKM